MADIEEKAANLMRAGRFEEASSYLAEARELARRRNDMEDASFWGTLLGSCFLAWGRDHDALKAYLQAEADNPEDPYIVLALANALVNVIGRPEEAVSRLEKILPKLAEDRSSYHAGLSTLGVAYLALDLKEIAGATFREMTKPEVVQGLHPRGLDLRNVERWIELGQLLPECKKFLSLVIKAGEDRGEPSVVQRARMLLSRIDGQGRR